jgi:hypothetical protein
VHPADFSELLICSRAAEQEQERLCESKPLLVLAASTGGIRARRRAVPESRSSEGHTGQADLFVRSRSAFARADGIKARDSLP